MNSSSSSSPASPRLPTEVKGHILSFCDQSTLAKCSTLSLTFLELSSPLLYEDVVIQGLDNLHKLFCAREDPSFQSHLHSYLALTQIKKFALFVKKGDIPPDKSPFQNPIQINPDRLGPPFPLPLPLRSLTISLPLQRQTAPSNMLVGILGLFDPTSFHLDAHGPQGQEEAEGSMLDFKVPLVVCYKLQWRRLRHVSFKKTRTAHMLSGLLADPNPSFTATYDLSSTEPGSPLWNAARFDFLLSWDPTEQLDSGFVVNGLERVDILVPTEEGKEDVLMRLRKECERKFGEVGWDKLRRNVEVIVVPAPC